MRLPSFFRIIHVRSAIVLGAALLATRTAGASGGPALTVDATVGNRYPISSGIYGADYADEATAKALGVTVDRFGSDASTRYNWQIDAQNAAADYYFESLGNGTDPGTLPNGSSSDLFVEKDQRIGAQPIISVPLIGWTAKSRSFSCSFSVAKYGTQQSTDAGGGNPDCGNGIKPDGVTKITGNDPTDTSVAIDQTFDAAWVNHLTGRYGTAASGGVPFYEMDNEPEYWSGVHFDVHPNPLSYDELGNKTTTYAAAVKAADPTAKIFGPAISDWYSYFDSPLDQVNGNTNDQTAHGGQQLIPWYLGQMQAYQTAHGTRLIDYLDVHYYTTSDNVWNSPQTDAATDARRLRSTRELWDSTYTNEGYIGTPIALIPMLRGWIANNYPGTKIAITEYDWGVPETLNGALAQADVLGIFGREKVDVANVWDLPGATQPAGFAFLMYRNYDGAGSQFGDSAVSASSADQGQLSVYGAVRSSDGALTLMIINKTGSDLTSSLSLNNFNAGATAQDYLYSGANLGAIVRQADQSVSTVESGLTYPANSITLLVIPAGTSSAAKLDTIGIYRGGQFYLRLSNTTGYSDIDVALNPPGTNLPIVGDWTGSGFDAVGVYDTGSGVFTLCNANDSTTCANSANLITFTLGNPNDTPLSGHWFSGATHDGAGVYRPSNGILYVRNTLSTGFSDHAMVLGNPGDVGVAGDWTGKGYESPGVYRPSQTEFYLLNTVSDGIVNSDLNFTYGNSTDLPIAGDWVAQGHDGPGMFRPSNGYAYLRDAVTTGNSDTAFFYGNAGDQPIAGHWQVTYPVPKPVVITKTATPQPGSISVPGGNQIGG